MSFTAAELEKVIENLRFDSLARGMEASALVSEWIEQEQQTLPSLVSLAPSGLWQELLEEHRRAMSSLLSGIDMVAAANNSLLKGGAPAPAGEGIEASDVDLSAIALAANIQRAVAAVASASLPAVREFLGP
ncbi:hypothetical protein ACIPY3_00215 [Paenarthrobacter sp. NPDC089714]|uniref:hypothetical protein n=1 Tax=Paenarthrobacter sp. NPDC089714 TaxID=3364377 RepID=UPI003822928F